MTRTISESIAGMNMTIPAANDGFSVEVGGLPNGDDCLKLDWSLVTSPIAGDLRAFAAAPTLSPNFMNAPGAGPFSMSFWFKAPNAIGSQGFRMGVETASAGGGGTVDNRPIEFAIGFPFNGAFTLNTSISHGTAGGRTDYATGNLTNTADWVLIVFGYGAAGNPGMMYIAYKGGTPPISITGLANRGANSGTFTSGQNFFIGRYSTGTSFGVPNRVVYLGKMAFHNHLLTVTECKMLFEAMV